MSCREIINAKRGITNEINMNKNDLRERAIAKAVAKIESLKRKIKQYEEPMPNISNETRQLVIDVQLREIEVWELILNSVV